MTCGELALEAILSLGVFAGHDAGIVHEYVDVGHVGPAIHSGSRFSNRLEGFEIQLQGADWDIWVCFGKGLCCLLIFGRVSSSENEKCWLSKSNMLIEEGTKPAWRNTCCKDDFIDNLTR